MVYHYIKVVKNGEGDEGITEAFMLKVMPF